VRDSHDAERGVAVPVMGVARFERFFRAAAGLDVDKDDLKRYDDFVHEQIYDLLLIAQARARANGRDVIEMPDLPITKGVQERIHEYEKLDQDIELQPILERLATRPPLDIAVADDVEQRLPTIAGGLSVALARSFELIDPGVKNPQTWQWERAFHLFELLL
jgi:hypothetical protein